MAESTSTPGLPGRVPVLAIRKADERFIISLKGLTMTNIENVSESYILKYISETIC